MALPNDSILVTPGSGATLATELVSSKEYGAWIEVDALGHIPGARDLWCYSYVDGDGTGAASNDRGVLALWNGTGSGKTVEIVGAQIAQSSNASGGVSNAYLSRITAEATDGPAPGASSVLTARKVCRSSAGALPAQITGRATVAYDSDMTFTRTGDPLLVGSYGIGLSFRASDLRARHAAWNWQPEPILIGENDGVVLTASDINGSYRMFVALYFRVR